MNRFLNNDITRMSYSNSFNLKKKEFDSNDKNINEEIKGNHIQNYKFLYKNLKQENSELKKKINMVLEKDKKIYELQLNIDKLKKIILKYDEDYKIFEKYSTENESLKKNNSKLNIKLKALIKKISIFKNVESENETLKKQVKTIKQENETLQNKVKDLENINDIIKKKLIKSINKKE